jgi:hypothetical protein
MGVRFPSVQSNTLLNASVGINVETPVCTTPPLNLPLDNAVVLLFWYIVHFIGTTAATTRYLIRRGTTIAGTLVNVSANLTGTAGNQVLGSGFYFDTPGAVAGQQYTLSCIDPASTVAGGIADAALLAFVL